MYVVVFVGGNFGLCYVVVVVWCVWYVLFEVVVGCIFGVFEYVVVVVIEEVVVLVLCYLVKYI